MKKNQTNLRLEHCGSNAEKRFAHLRVIVSEIHKLPSEKRQRVKEHLKQVIRYLTNGYQEITLRAFVNESDSDYAVCFRR